MFVRSVGLTATPVSFCDELRPTNPAADWLVQSWFTRTLVPLASEHPTVPGPGTGGVPFGAVTPFGRRATAVGSTLTTPEGATRLVRPSFLCAAWPDVAPRVRNAMTPTTIAMRSIRRILASFSKGGTIRRAHDLE